MPGERYDLIVLGGGSAGLTAAMLGRYFGRRVLLVEKNRLGGDCLHTGCVPSKALLKSAHVAHLIRQAPRFGLPEVELPSLNLGRVMGHVLEVIHRIGEGESTEKLASMGIDLRFDAPVFASPRLLRIGADAYEWKHCLIATGSRPHVPAIPGLAESGFHTTESLFTRTALPPRLVVLGGGPVGVEMAQAFARLGSSVTILARGDRLLPREDPEVSALLQSLFRREGILVYPRATLAEVRLRNGVKELRCTVASTGSITIETEEILVATGRLPNVEGMGLDQAGVEYGPEGIRVDGRFRTTAPRIWACGDVNGRHRFTHMAEYQAKIALANAFFRIPLRADDRVIPWVTFTDPEVARVGRTEEDLRREGIRYRIYQVPFSQVDRAMTDGEAEGFMKILAAPNGQILGAHLIGPHAGELLHELVLAMRARLTLAAIAGTIHAYPTLSHGLRRAADLFLGDLLTHSWWGKLIGLLTRRGRG